MIFDCGLDGLATVLLKTLEGVHIVILHKVFVEDADQSLLLQRDGVHREVLRHGAFGVHRREFAGGAGLGGSSSFVFLLFCFFHGRI